MIQSSIEKYLEEFKEMYVIVDKVAKYMFIFRHKTVWMH